jgi:L,D-transpeptidase-like protein
MPRIAATIIIAVLLLCASARAEAGVVVIVDKSTQRLTVAVDGVTRYRWPVSTARWGYRTPNGSYRPQRLERKWFSRKYDWSPMPHSIFFAGGYAIHGSYEVSRLGRPASHGCIRLHPSNAAVLFALVKENVGDTRIIVTGGQPPATDVRRRVRPIEPAPRVLEPIEPAPRMPPHYLHPAPYQGESFDDIFERRRPGPYYGPRYGDDGG